MPDSHVSSQLTCLHTIQPLPPRILPVSRPSESTPYIRSTYMYTWNLAKCSPTPSGINSSRHQELRHISSQRRKSVWDCQDEADRGDNEELLLLTICKPWAPSATTDENRHAAIGGFLLLEHQHLNATSFCPIPCSPVFHRPSSDVFLADGISIITSFRDVLRQNNIAYARYVNAVKPLPRFCPYQICHD